MFLGVRVDQNLSFWTTILYITSKSSENTGIFYPIRDNLTTPARIHFYYALLFPFISYNIIIWGGTISIHFIQYNNNYNNEKYNNLGRNFTQSSSTTIFTQASRFLNHTDQTVNPTDQTVNQTDQTGSLTVNFHHQTDTKCGFNRLQ